MFPFCLIGFITIPVLLTLEPRNRTINEKFMRVDWVGGSLFIASNTSFLMAISWGGTQAPWGSFRTLVPLILGITGLAFATYGGTAIQGFLVRKVFLSTCNNR